YNKLEDLSSDCSDVTPCTLYKEMSHSGTRQIPHDSDKENAMDINLDKQVEDNEPTSSSKYEKILNNETYDPDQDKDEKRWLRREYRNLISETEEKRQDYLRSDSDGLALNIAKANELVQKVKNTHEATLDSRLLVLTSDLGVQKARHWNAIGELASHHTLRVPTMEFILGPLSVEQKERVRGIRQTVAKNKNDLVMPKQLEEKDIERQENETTKNVRNIYNILMEKQPINFFEFIVNPESFGQTIENLFYLSFLVRDAKVDIDDESACCEPPTGDEYAEGLIKKQLVMGIDMNTWKELIEVYNIRVSAIPTRQSCTQISGKWYG
ncbi:7307_t:CDS:2, partial [Gigaspora margarita]